MTALEAFNTLDNREVSRKEVEQVLTQAKAENNTAIIYRLSRVLNDSPEATHFEITITHYDSSVGLSGVQHTGDYREALDDCGRLRKGWKFLKGNVIKVEKKEKPKKGKTPKKETKPVKSKIKTGILKLRTALAAPHQEDEIAFLAGAGIDYFEEAPDDEPQGLGKPVPAADIYKMITDKIIGMLKSASPTDYHRAWKDEAFFIPLNYDSKKPYRGINRLLLQERIGFAGAFHNPYFLTFKQIKKHKGTLKKGAKGYEVVYFSIRYVVPADKNSGRKAYSSTNAQKVLDFLHKYNLPESEVTRIPMIRYYNVYNGEDITGINFKLPEVKIGRAVPDTAPENQAAQLIVENYPNPPAIKYGGNEAYYSPARDYIKLPKQEQFDTVNAYYRTLFHELTHSTGHKKRLNRGIHFLLDDDYAKEELVAEFGAVFLSAWAGIMWYNNKNHAAYLKGWNSAIKEAQNDNKFLMRAASLAQQATDYILNLNAEGEPAFLAELAKINPKKEEKKQPEKEKKTKKATKKPQKNTENPEHHKYFQEKKKEAEIQLKEAIERVKKSNYRDTAVEYAQVVALKCEMIKHIEENAKLYNATPAELEYIQLYLSYLTIDQVKYHFIKNDHYMSSDMVGLKPHFSRLFSKTRPKAFAKVKDRKYSYKFNENGKKFINDYVELYENFYKNPPTFEDNKIAEYNTQIQYYQKELKTAIKFSDIDNNRTLIESFTDKKTGTSRLFVKDSLGLTFSFSPLEKFMAVEQIFALYGKNRKEEAEKDYSRMKEEIAWAFNHHVRTAQRKGTLEVCEKYFLENLPELLAKGGLWLEAKAKNKGAAAAKSSLTKLRRQVWEDIGALAVGESTENVQDSSKKKLEKAPAKATKSLKSRKEKGENVANFTLLQEPTKVFLEFEDEKNQAYYKKSADKQGAVGADFLKKVLKELKKQNHREEPRGFINTEDFPVSPTISKVTGIDSLKTVVVKDKNRPTLECVLIEADRYVATDLYNIILLNRSKNDGLKTGALYDPNYKCTKIGGCSKEDYYRILDYGFPNYKPILTENPVYTSDWVAIEPIIQHLKSGLEVIRKIYDWKRVYVVKITSNVGEGHYNLKYLLNDLQILQSNGAKKIRLYTNKLDEKLNIETDNGNIVVTMAVYIGDRSNYDVISPLRIAPIQLHFTQNRKEEKGLSGVDYSQGLFGDIGLNAPRHEGILKEALTEKGKLKKGWYFQDYGIIDPKGKYHPLEREFAYEYKVASDELNSRAFEQNEKRKRKGFEENIQLQDNLKDFFKSLSQKYKKYFKNYKAVEIFYWAFNFGEKPTKFFTIDETNPYNETQLKVFDKYFSNKNKLFTRLENYETLRRYNLTDLGYNIISEIDSFLNKEGKKVRGDIKKINKKYGLNAPSVPEVSAERFKTLKEAKKYYKEWASENLRGKKVYHKELDKYILFSSKGIDHVLSSNISFDKMKLILQAEEMLKNSHIIAFEEDYKKRDNVKGVYRMSSKAILDKEEINVILTLREGENGVIYYDHKIEEIERNTTPPRKSHANPFCGDSASFEDKGTKKSLSRKKKEENFGLNASEAPINSLPAPRQTLAQQLATRPEVRESFLVADEQMSLFLGALEKKTKDSLVITLTGKQGSGKTRFAFQFMNALAQRYRVGHASIEEHPESVLYEEKAYQYLNDTALEHITAQDVRSLAELDTMIHTNEVIVIDSFQKMRELAPKFEVDKDLRKKYDGKLFLVIFQQTADGKMRGGSKSQFDGDIILFTETFPDYRENYVYPDKNRYNKRPATELQYSIYEQRMLATAPEVPALPAHYEPTESEELNFEVL